MISVEQITAETNASAELQQAVVARNLDLGCFWLQQGADPNYISGDQPLLHHARNLDMILLLLEGGKLRVSSKKLSTMYCMV